MLEGMLDAFDPTMIQDVESAKKAIVLLLNMFEEQAQEIIQLKEENQKLKDENNRLKGEQGKPDVKGGKKNTDHSSEKERKKQKKRSPRTKRKPHKDVSIDREEKVSFDRGKLPSDAEFKGYEEVVVQDVVLRTDNVRFLKEKWYSRTTKQTYIAPLPSGYEGQFGPTVKALVLSLYYGGGMSAPKIIEFVEQLGVNLSKGTVSTWLSGKTEPWEAEADEIIKAGLASTDWQHLDDTSTRVDGENNYCHILCNRFYTAYATRPRKDRVTVIGVLQNREQPLYLFNEQTATWLELFDVPQWAQRVVATWEQAVLLDDEQLKKLFEGQLSDRLNDQQQARIREAGALSMYYAQHEYPVIPILISDDAPQFRHLTAEQMLCWVHEGRHYKKLTPHLPYHRRILDDFLEQFWTYYHKLQAYRETPDPPTAEALRTEFDTLFGQTTDYDHLNQRLAKTWTHKQKLLVVLDHPDIPLHNNPAELGARQRVRKRDVSFGPRSQSGRIAWDVFMTVVETSKKLGVSFYRYLFDRVSMQNAMPSLADLIRAQGQTSYP